MPKIKAVILAGGFETHLSKETALRPKPMIEIRGKPILWHPMEIYVFDQDQIVAFKEKPHGEEGWINGGFGLLPGKAIDCIDGDELCGNGNQSNT